MTGSLPPPGSSVESSQTLLAFLLPSIKIADEAQHYNSNFADFHC